MNNEKSCKTCDGIPCGGFGKLNRLKFTFPNDEIERQREHCPEWQDDWIDRDPVE